MDWQKALLMAGGAAGIAAVLYYLLKDDPEAERQLGLGAEGGEKAPGGAAKGDSKAEVLEILQDMVASQEVMKSRQKVLAKELSESPISVKELYDRVKEGQPNDPLEQRGLSMADLDRMLQAHHTDPGVMAAMQRLMGGPDPTKGGLSEAAKGITTEKITEIHHFMLEELQKFVNDFKRLGNLKAYDVKTATMASQAMLDAKITAKFGIASEDMEQSIMLNQQKLAQNESFVTAHMRIQQTMEQFMNSF